MGSLQCEVCLKEDGEVLASPLLPPLLHKHLGVLVYEQVMSCEGCSQLLQLWDDFSTQAKTNLATTHPSAQHQYAIIKEMETPGGDEHGKEDEPEQDDDSDNEIRCTVSCADTISAAAMWSELQDEEDALELQARLELGVPANHPQELEMTANQHQDFEMPINEDQELELGMSVNQNQELGEPSNQQQDIGELADNYENKHSTGLSEIVATHVCSYCRRGFLYEKSLKLHVQACHLGAAESTKLSCPVCHGCLSTQFQMDQHIRLCHSSAEPELREQKTTPNYRVESEFVCEVCGEDLGSKLRLDQHMRTQHRPVPYLSKNRFKCPYCPKTLKGRKSQILHIKNYHSKKQFTGEPNTEFTCKICGKSFSRKLGLVTHLRFHPENLFSKKGIGNNGEGTSSGTHEFSETEVSNHSDDIPISPDKKYKKRDSLYYCNFCMKSEASEVLIQCHIEEYHIIASSSKSPANIVETRTNFVEQSPEGKRKKVEQLIQNGSGKREEQFTRIENTFSCNFCGKILSSFTGIDYHINRHHVPDNLAHNSKQYHKVGPHFGCNICDKVLVTESGILYHVRHTHYKHTLS